MGFVSGAFDFQNCVGDVPTSQQSIEITKHNKTCYFKDYPFSPDAVC